MVLNLTTRITFFQLVQFDLIVAQNGNFVELNFRLKYRMESTIVGTPVHKIMKNPSVGVI